MSVQKHIEQRVAPSKSYLSGQGTERATMSQASTFIVHMIADDGTPCVDPIPTRNICCQLVSSVNGRSKCIRPRLLYKEKSQYQFTYTPTHPTREAILTVKVCGEEVRGSPFSVVISVSIALHALKSGPVEIMGGLISPHGIAVQSDRMRVITESERQHCVCVYNHDGSKVSTFGSKGVGPGEFNNPRGITVDVLDNIFVADSGNHRIQKFSKSFELTASVGKEGKKNLQFKQPSGVSVDPISGKIFVADTGNHRIQVLNEDLSFSHTFGKKGGDIGHLHSPSDVSVSVNGFVYVADTDNSRIQVFTTDGRFVRQFGHEGLPERHLDQPLGVAVDCAETAIVTSSMDHHVYIYDCHGNLVLILGKRGDVSSAKQSRRRASMRGVKPGEFISPVGVTIDAGGFVYLIDKDNARMQMYL